MSISEPAKWLKVSSQGDFIEGEHQRMSNQVGFLREDSHESSAGTGSSRNVVTY